MQGVKDEQEEPKEKSKLLMKLKMVKMYKAQVQKDFVTFLLKL